MAAEAKRPAHPARAEPRGRGAPDPAERLDAPAALEPMERRRRDFLLAQLRPPRPGCACCTASG